jgi:hypothetical protein
LVKKEVKMSQPTDEVPDPALEDARRLEHEVRPTLASLERIEGALAGIGAILATDVEEPVT